LVGGTTQGCGRGINDLTFDLNLMAIICHHSVTVALDLDGVGDELGAGKTVSLDLDKGSFGRK
jgi:hypothetical protein